MRAGRESDDDQACVRVAKGRHGPSPISPIAIRASLGARDFLAVMHQSGTLTALRDFAFECGKWVVCQLCVRIRAKTAALVSFPHKTTEKHVCGLFPDR